MNIELQMKTISEKTYSKILTEYGFLEKVDDMSKFKCGYKDSYVIRYDDTQIIIRSGLLYELLGVDYDPEFAWKQVLLVMRREQSDDLAESISPGQARRIMNGIIAKHYTEEEKEAIYGSHEREDSTILHYNLPGLEIGRVLKLEDCWYYDINGAYASVLSSMFPECGKEFRHMFEHRHDCNNKYKNVFNFFVGCLTQNEKKRKAAVQDGRKVRKIYPKTRHWIVNQITEKMNAFEAYLGADLVVYENTDGLIVHKPKNKPAGSKKMFEFKLEYSGDVYIYRGKNYLAMQYGDEIKGSLPLELRDRVDLRRGKVVEYDNVVVNGVHRYINIKEIDLNEESN